VERRYYRSTVTSTLEDNKTEEWIGMKRLELERMKKQNLDFGNKRKVWLWWRCLHGCLLETCNPVHMRGKKEQLHAWCFMIVCNWIMESINRNFNSSG
jgi:hypothetical protein